MGYGAAMRGFGKVLKKFRDRVTHEVPTGPHTDVRRRKINPSLKAPSLPTKVPDAKGGFRAAKRRPTK